MLCRKLCRKSLVSEIVIHRSRCRKCQMRILSNRLIHRNDPWNENAGGINLGLRLITDLVALLIPGIKNISSPRGRQRRKKLFF